MSRKTQNVESGKVIPATRLTDLAGKAIAELSVESDEQKRSRFSALWE